ncbi:plasminogen-like isoform X1 [Mizuhopecten yessoensis]|uniref:plasminogen-like isoform X1 n=1 Tax=Mizuhopecten yessoensis TaxID=6573 RepID=UPI000B459149|nr:plasminogen-like isoform X1 [Mizuhopecten yessoensis]
MARIYRESCLTMSTVITVTLLIAVGPTPGIGETSVPVKMTYSTIYRIRSRSLLPSGLFFIVHGVSDIQCYARCLLSTRCLSVNYKRANQMCEMSTMTVATASSATSIDLINNDEYHFMDKMDFPAGLGGQCADSSDLEENCRIPAPSCSLDDKFAQIIEEKGDELLAHSSCPDERTELCDTNTNTWRPHTRNCPGLQTNREDPSPVPVTGVETFVERPYDGIESTVRSYKGERCHAQHKCRNLAGFNPMSYCPVSRFDCQSNWTVATLSCSEYDCFDTANVRYMGRVSCTVGGTVCQRWDTNTPHTIGAVVAASIASMTTSNNWCMPIRYHRPWCYTTDPNIRWDVCPVDDCQ